MITPSHNPPEDGGIKYNPPNGGPADTNVTKVVEDRANALMADGLKGVKRISLDEAMASGHVKEQDLVQPFVEGRFHASGEAALMGESLAGLFVVETFLKAPELFDHYVAVSPSLWWDGGRLAAQAGAHLRDHSNDPRTLILTLGDEGPQMQAPMDVLLGHLRDHALPGVDWSFTPRPDETHASIYHGAALDAFRQLFAAETP